MTTAGTAILGNGKHLDGDRDVGFANVGANAGGGATPYNSTTRACQAYCHSSAGPWNGTAYGTPTYASVTWGQTAAVGCASCHGGAGAATTMSGPHAKHVNSKASGNYAYGCQVCHWTVTQDGTTILAGSTLHVNGVKTDVAFNTASRSPPPAPPGAAAGRPGPTPARARTATENGTPSWSGTVACNGCHGTVERPRAGRAQPGDCVGCHPGYTDRARWTSTST